MLRTEQCVTNGYDDQRHTRDEGKVDYVNSMEMGALEVGSLGDMNLLHWDDTIMHLHLRRRLFMPFPRRKGSKTSVHTVSVSVSVSVST